MNWNTDCTPALLTQKSLLRRVDDVIIGKKEANIVWEFTHTGVMVWSLHSVRYRPMWIPTLRILDIRSRLYSNLHLGHV